MFEVGVSSSFGSEPKEGKLKKVDTFEMLKTKFDCEGEIKFETREISHEDYNDGRVHEDLGARLLYNIKYIINKELLGDEPKKLIVHENGNVSFTFIDRLDKVLDFVNSIKDKGDKICVSDKDWDSSYQFEYRVFLRKVVDFIEEIKKITKYGYSKFTEEYYNNSAFQLVRYYIKFGNDSDKYFINPSLKEEINDFIIERFK